MEYITQKFILNKGNKINIRLDNPLELPGNEWFCGLKEFSLEPKWSLAEDEITVNFQDGTSVTVKPINTHAAANIDTVLEELFPKWRRKRSAKSRDVLGDITGFNRKKAKLAEESKEEQKDTPKNEVAEDSKKDETTKQEPAKEEKKEESKTDKSSTTDSVTEDKKEAAAEPKKEDSTKEEKKEQHKTVESNTEENKKEEPKTEGKKEESKKEESKKEETIVGTDFVVDNSKLVLNYEKGHYPEKNEAEKLVDEKQKKPDIVSSLTGTQAKQEQKQQELAAQQPRAEAQFFDGAVMQKYKEEQKLKEDQKLKEEEKLKAEEKLKEDQRVKEEQKLKEEEKLKAEEKLKEEQKLKEDQRLKEEEKLKEERIKEEKLKEEQQKIEIPSKNPVSTVVDVKEIEDLSTKAIPAKEEQKTTEQKTADLVGKYTGTKAKQEQKEANQKTTATEQKADVSEQKVPIIPEVPSINSIPEVSNVPKVEEKVAEKVQKSTKEEQKNDITMSEKSVKSEPTEDITMSEEIESTDSKENFEKKLAGLKSINFTKINNRYAVTFDTNHIHSLKLSHGFAQAIGYITSTTLFDNQIASDPPSVSPFYSHVCVFMHGILRPLNKNHDAELAVVPIEKGKNVYSFYTDPLYLKVEKTFIDTITLEFRDFLDNPIVCDRSNGHFVLQFVKSRK